MLFIFPKQSVSKSFWILLWNIFQILLFAPTPLFHRKVTSLLTGLIQELPKHSPQNDSCPQLCMTLPSPAQPLPHTAAQVIFSKTTHDPPPTYPPPTFNFYNGSALLWVKSTSIPGQPRPCTVCALWTWLSFLASAPTILCTETYVDSIWFFSWLFGHTVLPSHPKAYCTFFFLLKYSPHTPLVPFLSQHKIYLLREAFPNPSLQITPPITWSFITFTAINWHLLSDCWSNLHLLHRLQAPCRQRLCLL